MGVGRFAAPWFRGTLRVKPLAACVAIDLAATIRDKIRSGALPLPPEPPERYFAGKGTGRLCDICEQAITTEHLEFELDVGGRTLAFTRNASIGGGRLAAERLATTQASSVRARHQIDVHHTAARTATVDGARQRDCGADPGEQRLDVAASLIPDFSATQILVTTHLRRTPQP